MGMREYYGVKVGRNKGIYNSWEECQPEVNEYSGAQFKKFYDKNEAIEYVEGIKIRTPRNNKEYETTVEGITLSYRPLIKEDTEKGEVVAYVDGSHTPRTEGFGIGVIMVSKEMEDVEISQLGLNADFISMENVAGELVASMVAISKAYELGYKKIYLHYDYEGVEKWATNNWTANKESTIQYRKYVQAMAKDFIDICFIKVKAHTGIHYNEIADTLAKKAVGLS